LLVQAIKVYYEKSWETTGTLAAIMTIGGLDVLIVLFWKTKAADYTCILRIFFVVSMR
jgi:hypothetical protein